MDIEKITKDLDTLLTSVTQVVKDAQAEHLGTDASQLLVELRETLQDARRVLDNPHLT